MAINQEDPSVVYLNVYDDSTLNRKFLHWLGFHFYLTSIRVHGHEYTFNNETGIAFWDPINAQRGCQGQKLVGSFPMGRTKMDPNQVLVLATNTLTNDFTNHSYNNFTNNCNHYCDHLCRALTGQQIPSWVNRGANFGKFLQCVMHVDGRRIETSANVDHHGEITIESDEGNQGVRIEVSAKDDSDDEIKEEGGDRDEQGARVYLYVHEINSVAKLLIRLIGIRLYRSFVQVHGRDYAFIPRLNDGDYVGITTGREWCHGLRLRERILIGHTNVSEIGVSTIVEHLEIEFPKTEYRHFSNNCHHFADRLCRELTGNGIPPWVNNIATFPSSLCSCLAPDEDPQQRWSD